MGKEFLNDLNIHGAGQIQFKTTAGANAGKIDQDGNDLVLSNAVGDIIIGNGSDDVFIGDGTNAVDIRFEQNMAIFADSSSTKTLTLGGSNTSLVLESPTINGSLTLGATTINNKLTFTTGAGYIVFDYEPSTGSNAEYTNEVPLLKIDHAGTEKTILSRLTNNAALAIGNDDTVAIVAGDTKSVIKANHNFTAENIIFASEGGFIAYGFPNNDPSWSNRNVFEFRGYDATAANNGLHIGSGGQTQFIDLSRNLKNIGTISSGAITSTGKIQGTELEGTSLDINGNADIAGELQVTSNGTSTLILRGDNNNSGDTGQLDSTIKMLHDDGTHGILMETKNYAGKQSFEIKSLSSGTESSRFLIHQDNYITTSGDILPQTDNSKDLGSSSYRWQNVVAVNLHGDGSNITGVNASNADTVDNLHAASFLRSDAADTAHAKINFSQNAASVAFIGTNHTYQEFYKTGTSNGRSAYLGFGSSSSNHFNIANEISGGKVIIDTNSGSVEINDDTTISGTLTVTGNLNITGDIDSYSVNNLDVVDKLITVGKGQTEANSNGSGIFVDGSSASLLWDETNNTWDFNKSLDVVGNINASGNITFGDSHFIGDDSFDNLHILASSGENVVIQAPTSNSIYLKTAGGSTLQLDENQNATFAGDINGDKITLTQGAYTDGYRLIRSGHDTYRIALGDSQGLQIINETDSNRKELMFDGDGNATFGNKVIIPQTSTTIGGSNLGSASLLLGSTTAGIGIDTNEIVSIGDHLYIGTATDGKNIIFRTDATSAALTLDSSQNATFAGNITSGRLNITDAAVPIMFTESGNTGTGKYWRQVLDAGDIRFDVDTTSTNGDGSFSSYNALIQLNADGHTDINGALDVAGNIDANGNLDVAGNIVVAGTVDGRDIATDGTKLDTIDTNADVTPSWVPSSDPNYLTSHQSISHLAPKASPTFTGDITIPNKIIHAGDTNTYMQFEAADVWRVVTGGTERLDINNNRILVGDGMMMQYDNISGGNVDGNNVQQSGNSGTVVKGGFLNPASESNMVHIPHIINDLAGFNKWSNATITTSGFYGTRSGSSGSYTYSNEIANDNSGWANAFDSHSSTAGSWYSDNGSDGIYQHGTDTPGVVELAWTNEATYSLWAGIVFGSGSFTATYVKIEAYRAGAWQTLCEITDNTDQIVLRQVAGNSGTNAATTKLRYTLGGSVNNSYFRIHSLYMANYRAGDNNLNNTGTDTTRGVNFLERYKDGYLHGHLRPGKDNTYDLGSSSYEWKDGYFDGTVYLDGINLDGNTITGVNDSGEFDDDDSHIMTSAGIDDRISTRISGLTSNAGTVTSVGATAPVLSSGGTTPTISVDTAAVSSGSSKLATGTQIQTAIDHAVGSSLPLAGGTMTGDLELNDNVKAEFGTGNDLEIYHDGTNSVINNKTGHLQIYNNANDGDISFISDNGLGGTNEYLRIDGGTTKIEMYKYTRFQDTARFTSDVTFDDNSKAKFGDGDDLKIYHDGSNSYIQDTGTGSLIIKGSNTIAIRSADDENYFHATSNGSVKLYYNNSTKLETTNTGISVTGDIADRDIPCLFNSNFEDAYSTSILVVPFNNNAEATVSSKTYYHYITIPYAGKVTKVVMKNVSGTLSSGFTTQLFLYVNGSQQASSSEISLSGSSVTWTPTTNNTFSAGDTLTFGYQKSALKTFGGVSFGVAIELTDYDI